MTREETIDLAADICQLAASNVEYHSAYRHVIVDTLGNHVRDSVAYILALRAWEKVVRSAYFDDSCAPEIDAEAEALLRSGWLPRGWDWATWGL